MLNITQTVLDTVRRENLFSPGDTVYVALSGGADSVMLLHVLCELQDTLSLKAVKALHVNHGLRGEYADRDEQFVRSLCESLHIPLTVERADIPTIVQQTHKTVEEAARDVRYDFFKRETDGVERAKIATAHTADDHAETVLLRIIRGCSLRGLRGIPYCRDNIVRPLLDCTAEQVRACATQQHIAFVYDETNDDERYTRNYVRHRIIPALKEVNPAVLTAISRLSERAAADDDYLQKEARTVLVSNKSGAAIYRRQPLVEAPEPLLTRMLATAFNEASGIVPEQRHISNLLNIVHHGGVASLPGDWIARSDEHTLRFYRTSRQKESKKMLKPCILQPNENVSFLGYRYTATILSSSEFQKIHKNLLDLYLDYDRIVGSLYLRTRQDGDHFRPAKRGCTKTLKQFFQEQHIPTEQRDTIPLLCDNDGILAVLGHAIDERVALRTDTNHILHIQRISEGSN